MENSSETLFKKKIKKNTYQTVNKNKRKKY